MTKKIVLLLTIFGMFFTACDEIGNDGSEPFSQLSVEDNKEIIELSGIQMINTMEDMKDLDAVEVCYNLGMNLDLSDPTASKTTKKSQLAYKVDAIAGISDDNWEFNAFFNDLRYGGEIDDPQSIQEIWEEILGTYTWNSDLQDWDYAENTSEVILLFPALNNSTSNDGKLRIYGYEGVIVDNPIDEDYTGDLPTDLVFDISLNDVVVITHTFAASYNNDGIPTAVASDLSIPPFKWEVDVTNNDTEVSLNYKFTYNDDIVLEVGGGGKGLFTQANIDANTEVFTETYTWTDYVYNEYTYEVEEVEMVEVDEWEEVEFEEIINSTNVHVQLFTVLIKGDMEVKTLVDQIRIIEEGENENWTEADYTKEKEDFVVEINKNINLRVLNTVTNEKIAEVEAYVVTEMNEYGEDSWIDFRFVFGDESTIDAETYFDEGFENFVNEINLLIADLNAEYEIELESIEY